MAGVGAGDERAFSTPRGELAAVAGDEDGDAGGDATDDADGSAVAGGLGGGSGGVAGWSTTICASDAPPPQVGSGGTPAVQRNAIV